MLLSYFQFELTSIMGSKYNLKSAKTVRFELGHINVA